MATPDKFCFKFSDSSPFIMHMNEESSIRYFTDEFDYTWIIRQAFLEIKGPSQCNLLYLVADRTFTQHKVVFQIKLERSCPLHLWSRQTLIK